ncbi:MAG: TonB-dependent receptor [Tannerella sp.]|jgi:TonB-linked SusC/RagA family outer membrane protein|nr:TonB-dependent receptor [Tannerella sp.]
MKRRKIFCTTLIIASLLMTVCSATIFAQNGVTFRGRIVDSDGEPLAGAVITVVGSTRGAAADIDGKFELPNVTVGTKLKVTFLGMNDRELTFDGKNDVTITLEEKTSELDEVTIVAFAKQKKESVVSSITTINPAELKIPSSNLTTALAGRMAGIISYQRSGEPGADNAQFFIRGITTFGAGKVDPLILIDNVESSTYEFSKLQVDDIASFSILKDASASALYGARGANGVILITTKEGKEGKMKFTARAETSISQPASMIKTVGAVDYMKLANEAALTRNPLAPRPYSNDKIHATEAGDNPYLFPNVNWYDELFQDYALNHRINLSASGGGTVARYYVAGTFTNDKGVLKVDPLNNYNNNINLIKTQIRSNININMTKTTQMDIRVSGTFEDYTGPMQGGTSVFDMVMHTNPVEFPKYYPMTPEYITAKHPLFGNAGTGSFINPYAEMVRGYKNYSQTNIQAQIELKQKLDFLTEGLNFRLLASTTRDSYFDVTRAYTPFFYTLSWFDKTTGKYSLECLNPNGGKDFLTATGENDNISSSMYFEGALTYNRTFNEKHDVSGLLVSILREKIYSGSSDLQGSLPHRNIGLSGRFTYAYNHRYFVEMNFGYNGSERFSRKERFGFFPSAGLGWFISNEDFWNETLKHTVSKLKLKATYGLVGNDAIGSDADRFFYMSRVNLTDGNKNPFSFGRNFANRPSGVSISRYANEDITWETSQKANYGIELGLWNKVEIQADYFTEHRYNILMNRASIPSTMGLQAGLRANVGEAKSHGYEISLDVNHSFNKDFWITGRGNYTFADNYYKVYEEPTYPYPWLSWVGLNINQRTGYIAERLFIDEADIANSPSQASFGEYMPGDIKYKDVNGDDIINSQDNVPIGHPSVPKVMYGFGMSTGFKNADFSFFFQGSAQSAFFISPTATAPFQQSGSHTGNAVLQVWADSHWTEENRDIYALWPRLSPQTINNNTQRSTWFMRDGSFLRLKSVEFGFNLPQRWTHVLNMETARIYISGTNLLLFSKFDLWDIEMGENGLGYPVQRVFNLGLNINF